MMKRERHLASNAADRLHDELLDARMETEDAIMQAQPRTRAGVVALLVFAAEYWERKDIEDYPDIPAAMITAARAIAGDPSKIVPSDRLASSLEGWLKPWAEVCAHDRRFPHSRAGLRHPRRVLQCNPGSQRDRGFSFSAKVAASTLLPALIIVVCLSTASLLPSRPNGILPSQASYQSGRSSRLTIGTL